MPGITDPAEEYFKDGLWGWVTDAWKKLVATAGGALHIQFAGQEADVEVTQTAAADLTPGVCGWDGLVWRKLPLLWGYSDRWAEVLGGTQSGAGSYEKFTTAVPAGQVYVLEFVAFQNNTGQRGDVTIGIKDGTYIYSLDTFTTPTQYETCTWFGRMTLKAGDQVKIIQATCVNGDVLYGVAWGYKMKVAE